MELEESSIFNMSLQWKNKVKEILEILLTLEHELQNESNSENLVQIEDLLETISIYKKQSRKQNCIK
jgi:hypothetical protein